MNREIKFRIWMGGKFYYWGFIDGYFIGLPDNNTESLTLREVRDRSQQFTGLYDKKETYEGDIVDFTFKELFGDPHIQGVISINEFLEVFIDCLQHGVSVHIQDENIHDLKIIGNDQENPELLK